MYRIGELAKLADVTPDTIRYYEKQQMMDHDIRTEGGFRLYSDNDLQRLRFIRYARQLGFTLEAIRELLSIRGGVAGRLSPSEKCRMSSSAWGQYHPIASGGRRTEKYVTAAGKTYTREQSSDRCRYHRRPSA